MSMTYRLAGPFARPKGKFVLVCLDGRDGFKGRAAYLADNLASTYSHRAGGHVLSPAAARDFETLYAAGFTGTIRFASDPPRFDHDGLGVREATRKEALRIAAEHLKETRLAS